MGLEFRAVVTCTEDPCKYCRAPKQTYVPGEPLPGLLGGGITFSTPEKALEYGRGMARKVYGASTHSVSVESRPVHDWAPVASEQYLRRTS